jgi:hypothetical protein
MRHPAQFRIRNPGLRQESERNSKVDNSSIAEPQQEFISSSDAAAPSPKFNFDVRSLAWPAVVAVATGLITCLGLVRDTGRYRALGLYSLSQPTIDQGEISRGALTLLTVTAFALLPFVAGLGFYKLLKWISGYMPLWGKARLRGVIHSRSLLWIVFACVVLDSSVLERTLVTLLRQANGIILKNSAQAGTTWVSILLDPERLAASDYTLVYGGGLAFFVVSSRWLLTALFQRRWSRRLFTLWAVIQVLSLLILYASLEGVADTIDDFPLVAFSNQEALFGAGSVPVLLGSDDKQFALLIAFPNAKPDDVQREILYVPRSEVKWMIVLRLIPLQPLGKYDDLKRLAQNTPD